MHLQLKLSFLGIFFFQGEHLFYLPIKKEELDGNELDYKSRKKQK